jgi:hypothetical protein
MSRKSLLLAIAISVTLLGSVCLTVLLLIFHEPFFYRRAGVDEGEARQRASQEFLQEFNLLINGILNDKTWSAQFSETQINSYFAEDFRRLEKTIFPEQVGNPRVSIDTDRIRLAFRYGSKNWNTIVSLDMRIWLAAKEPNVVVLELQAMRLGSLPITVQSVLEHFSEAARRLDIDLSWHRHNGKPAAVVRFVPGRTEPSVQLMHVKLLPGMITLHGADRSKPPSAEPAPASVPAAAAKS